MSREIDKLIAEHVMEYQVIETDKCNGEDNYWLSKDGANVCLRNTWEKMALPNYSSDIADAWEVVEKMKECSVFGYLNLIGPNDETDKYWCHFSKKWPHPFDYDWYGNSDTAPMAICLAALKAKGIDV